MKGSIRTPTPYVVPPDRVIEFLDARAESLAKEHPNLTLILDELPVLDTLIIARLIVLLREVREHGGTVRLAVSRPGLLETIRINALDRIFDVIPVLGLVGGLSA
ncbi:MAG TPA: STAS domain-containing protein [Candidatus Baltobacteraceae bacterium]|jgi:anti-anti-sigma regulatory factor|nr:STAS domain-containing protein [Candidatus Baltobacteraceae bacterium]